MPVTVAAPGVAMPSSLAIAAAVRGWSPVIIFTLMPACRARRTDSATSARGGSIHADDPKPDQLLLDRLVEGLVAGGARQVAVGDADGSEGLAGELLDAGGEDLGTAFGRQGACLFAKLLGLAARQQHIGRPSR